MNRRSFMQSILSAGVAPYVVTTASVLMPVRKIVVLEGDDIIMEPLIRRYYAWLLMYGDDEKKGDYNVEIRKLTETRLV